MIDGAKTKKGVLIKYKGRGLAYIHDDGKIVYLTDEVDHNKAKELVKDFINNQKQRSA